MGLDTKKLSELWQDGAEAQDKYNLTGHPVVWQAISDYLSRFAQDKVVVDLGAGRGELGRLLPASTMLNVDPFPPVNAPKDLIVADGVQFLRESKDKSLDLVVATFAVHLMDREALDRELARTLRPGGRAIWFGSSATQPPSFGNPEFGRLFVSVGFEATGGGSGKAQVSPTTTLEVKRPMAHLDLYNFVTYRTWSNLKLMSDSEISHLASLIPADMEFINLYIDVYAFECTADGRLIPVEANC
jgi:SAM-dependent methyltransferase